MRPQCIREGCIREQSAKGLCASHYLTERNHRASQERKAAVRICEHCGESFSGRDIRARFCSDACKAKSRSARDIAERQAAILAKLPPCIVCGGKIPYATSKAICCSKSCGVKWGNIKKRLAKFGITLDEYRSLLAQHPVCAICETADWGHYGPCVDHDHITGRVRGILCGPCNTSLGGFKDDPLRLARAIAYLKT